MKFKTPGRGQILNKSYMHETENKHASKDMKEWDSALVRVDVVWGNLGGYKPVSCTVSARPSSRCKTMALVTPRVPKCPRARLADRLVS